MALPTWLALAAALAAQDARSAHRAQPDAAVPVRTDDAREADSLEARGELFPERPPGITPLASSQPVIDDPFIVFGYLQSEDQIFHTRWHALTHVGSRFVGFNSAGNLTGTSTFTGRSSYLKSGGAADAAGVKVILVVNEFDDSPGGTLETVMTSPVRRATLVNQIVSLLASDSYSHGVSLDLEFFWGSNVRDGVTAFMAQLRAALDASDPTYELSIYTNPIYLSNQWDFDATSGITPSIDYMLYSMYDWASGSTAHAISDFDNCLGSSKIHAYLNDGLPPEKLVPVISSYSRRWSNTGVYNGGGSSPVSSGFTDALYDVTLNPTFGGPYTSHYVNGDEAGWYSWNDGILRTRTWETLAGMEYKIRHALSLQDPAGVWNGRRIGGVGFWSLFWLAETSSIDPRTGASVSRTRTYPHVYQLCQEILAPPGIRRFLLEGFEGLDFRWRDPNESPDTLGDTDDNSSRTLILSPGGAGAPESSTNAMRVTFDFENGSGNRILFAHEVLASPIAPGVVDTNAALGHFPLATELAVRVYTSDCLQGYALRLVVIDAAGELEASVPTSLDGSGWRELAWDLTAGAAPYLTAEPAFQSGDGVLDSAGAGARDLAFFGFAIEGDGAGNGNVVLDELTYELVDPDARAYRINELRYSDPDQEFVEIHGPAGALTTGLELRVFDSAGSVQDALPLVGVIADSGDGSGFWVIGDPGVSNVDQTTTFGSGSDLPNADPSGIQLYGSATGHAYDSVVYEAYGGLDGLVRAETLGVTTNGSPWLGDIANGTDVFARPYTMGRYPDGRDTRRNADDFAFQPASPGEPNGESLTLPAAFDFETPPARAFTTYDSFSLASPAGVGLPASTNGGLAWRCVDDAGGGVIGVVGDAALGSTQGYVATGEIYVPTASAPAHAIAVGVAGTSGSNFFTSTAANRTAYESGYWLIYENRVGVGLADGRPDHAGVWELVHATHDNMDGERVQLLGSAANAALGVTPGQWATFSLSLQPANTTGAQLFAAVNGNTVYLGDLPADGPTRGAFQVGFRENHSGGPAAAEGAWIDDLSLAGVGPTYSLPDTEGPPPPVAIPCDNPPSSQPYCVSSPNSVSAVGAGIGYLGSLQISDNDFTLFSGPVPNGFGLFYFGTAAVQIPFQDGTRCVGGMTWRLPPAVLPLLPQQARRTLDFTDSLANESVIQPGGSWYFQYWFRDAAGGPAGANLSGGLEITFGL